jgi:hypothetical protein
MTYATGTVQCDPGHSTLVAGSVNQIAHNQLAQSVFNVFESCDGTEQSWSAQLFNTSGVDHEPGRAVTNAFAVDFDDFTFATPINQKINLKP